MHGTRAYLPYILGARVHAYREGMCRERGLCAEGGRVEVCMREGGGGGHGFTCYIL